MVANGQPAGTNLEGVSKSLGVKATENTSTMSPSQSDEALLRSGHLIWDVLTLLPHGPPVCRVSSTDINAHDTNEKFLWQNFAIGVRKGKLVLLTIFCKRPLRMGDKIMFKEAALGDIVIPEPWTAPPPPYISFASVSIGATLEELQEAPVCAAIQNDLHIHALCIPSPEMDVSMQAQALNVTDSSKNLLNVVITHLHQAWNATWENIAINMADTSGVTVIEPRVLPPVGSILKPISEEFNLEEILNTYTQPDPSKASFYDDYETLRLSLLKVQDSTPARVWEVPGYSKHATTAFLTNFSLYDMISIDRDASAAHTSADELRNVRQDSSGRLNDGNFQAATASTSGREISNEQAGKTPEEPTPVDVHKALLNRMIDRCNSDLQILRSIEMRDDFSMNVPMNFRRRESGLANTLSKLMRSTERQAALLRTRLMAADKIYEHKARRIEEKKKKKRKDTSTRQNAATSRSKGAKRCASEGSEDVPKPKRKKQKRKSKKQAVNKDAGHTDEVLSADIPIISHTVHEMESEQASVTENANISMPLDGTSDDNDSGGNKMDTSDVPGKKTQTTTTRKQKKVTPVRSYDLRSGSSTSACPMRGTHDINDSSTGQRYEEDTVSGEQDSPVSNTTLQNIKDNNANVMSKLVHGNTQITINSLTHDDGTPVHLVAPTSLDLTGYVQSMNQSRKEDPVSMCGIRSGI